MANLDQLERIVEGYKIRTPLSDEVLGRVGALVLEGHDAQNVINGVRIIHPPNERQLSLIERASLGDTTGEAAENLGWEETKVVEERKQLWAVFMVPTMAVVLDKSIQAGLLSFSFEGDQVEPLGREMDLILEAIRAGLSNNKIAKAMNCDRDQFGHKIGELLRDKLDANGRTNGILESYRHGYRKLPE